MHLVNIINCKKSIGNILSYIIFLNLYVNTVYLLNLGVCMSHVYVRTHMHGYVYLYILHPYYIQIYISMRMPYDVMPACILYVDDVMLACMLYVDDVMPACMLYVDDVIPACML